jgi:hypothetical protein
MLRLAPMLLPLVLTGCLGTTPERAEIVAARIIDAPGGRVLEVTQRLRFSSTMQAALESGIPLRLVYRIDACEPTPQGGRIELRYVALTRSWEVRTAGDATVRRHGRRSAMLASLDRVRLPLAGVPDADCEGRVAVALDLTSLPTPLRFPAFLQPEEWRLVSPEATWHAAPVR